ncbi:hypothetical protein K504DRAFT_453865 [Pleomassaria siparia CBS 279.74]|uniref:Uncharacterized protein n=1 Tax=Pleomassaria siparia CBS 279.74 TaxID=1314801 RepID=A0A6G1KEA7_9PLEO|nr:hypothetical protein K504DRAFT_453865 [Pleomassaria siparia CBS 279.74]
MQIQGSMPTLPSWCYGWDTRRCEKNSKLKNSLPASGAKVAVVPSLQTSSACWRRLRSSYHDQVSRHWARRWYKKRSADAVGVDRHQWAIVRLLLISDGAKLCRNSFQFPKCGPLAIPFFRWPLANLCLSSFLALIPQWRRRRRRRRVDLSAFTAESAPPSSSAPLPFFLIPFIFGNLPQRAVDGCRIELDSCHVHIEIPFALSVERTTPSDRAASETRQRPNWCFWCFNATRAETKVSPDF